MLWRWCWTGTNRPLLARAEERNGLCGRAVSVAVCLRREPTEGVRRDARRWHRVGAWQALVVVAVPEVHLVTWFDAELVSKFLGYDDLTLGSNRESHTFEYNESPRVW